MLFSAVYIAVESTHDCIGSDCQICREMRICTNALRTVGMAMLTVFCAGILLRLGMRIINAVSVDASSDTLVSLKIRLSN